MNQLHVPIEYKGYVFEEPLKLDVYVDDCLIVELKSVEQILPLHRAQRLIINFQEVLLKDGIERLMLPGAKTPD